MAFEGHSAFPEGFSTNRPPLFNGTNYSSWRGRMETFLQAQDVRMWKVILLGPYKATKEVEGRKVDKEPTEYTDDDSQNVQIHDRAKKFLH